MGVDAGAQTETTRAEVATGGVVRPLGPVVNAEKLISGGDYRLKVLERFYKLQPNVF